MERTYYEIEHQIRDRVSNYEMQAHHIGQISQVRNKHEGVRHIIGRIMIGIGQRMAGQAEVVSES